MNDWLSNLKTGDKVIVNNYGDMRIARVQKITPTGMIKVEGDLYNKDGSKRGAWYGFCLQECTPKIEEELARKSFIRRVVSQMRNIREITYEQAVEIDRIISEDK